jgi:hypothetical protein
VHNFLEGVEGWGIVLAFAKSNFWYGAVTWAHYLSIFSLVGLTMALNLHILGVVAKDQTATEYADQLFPLVWITLVVAVVTGFTLTIVAAGDYYISPVTRIKVLLTLFGFLCTLFIRRNVGKWDQAGAIPALGKLAAVAGILLWLGAVLAGNDIAAICGLG